MGNSRTKDDKDSDLHPLSRQRVRERRGSSLWFSENTRKEEWGRRFEKQLAILKSKREIKIPQRRFLEALKKRSCERTRLRLSSSKGLIDIPQIPSPSTTQDEKKYQIRRMAHMARRDSMERIRSRYLSRLNITPRRNQASTPPNHTNHNNEGTTRTDSESVVSGGRKRSESVSDAARRSRRRIESSEQFIKTQRVPSNNSPSLFNKSISKGQTSSIEHVIRDAPKRGRARRIQQNSAPRKIKLNYRRAYGLGFM